MRNASVTALIYELLFEVHRLMECQAGHWLSQDPEVPSFIDERGIRHQAFYHEHVSCWEWTTDALKIVGAVETVAAPCIRPLLTLDECRSGDFSRFESFDNYCFLKFAFEQLHYQYRTKEAGVVDLSVRSSEFRSKIAEEDDVFFVHRGGKVIFDESRYTEKVLSRWKEIEVRQIRPRD